jgi:hypothetical protein
MRRAVSQALKQRPDEAVNRAVAARNQRNERQNEPLKHG